MSTTVYNKFGSKAPRSTYVGPNLDSLYVSYASSPEDLRYGIDHTKFISEIDHDLRHETLTPEVLGPLAFLFPYGDLV